jgi:hypothetical protein
MRQSLPDGVSRIIQKIQKKIKNIKKINKFKSAIPQLVQIASPGEDALPDEVPQGDYGVWGLKALIT